MSARIVQDELDPCVVELSHITDTDYRGVASVKSTMAAFNGPNGLITLVSVNMDAVPEEGEQVVTRLVLTPQEMADLIQSYQAFLSDKEAAAHAVSLGDDFMAGLNEHPF